MNMDAGSLEGDLVSYFFDQDCSTSETACLTSEVIDVLGISSDAPLTDRTVVEIVSDALPECVGQ